MARCNFFHTPRRCHSRGRRQHVTPEPYPSSVGSSFRGMPARSTYRIPFSVARSSTQGRPPPSAARDAGGVAAPRSPTTYPSRAVSCRQATRRSLSCETVSEPDRAVAEGAPFARADGPALRVPFPDRCSCVRHRTRAARYDDIASHPFRVCLPAPKATGMWRTRRRTPRDTATSSRARAGGPAGRGEINLVAGASDSDAESRRLR
jgi:hypothetical protein